MTGGRGWGKSLVKSGGHSIPVSPEIAEALGGSLICAAIAQQVFFSHHGHGGVWHAWVPIKTATFAPKWASASTVSTHLRKLVELGVLEKGRKVGSHTTYRLLLPELQALVRSLYPEFELSIPADFARTLHGETCRNRTELPVSAPDDGDFLLARVHEEEENDNSNSNYKHVRSEERKEDNSTAAGTIWKAVRDYKCAECGGVVKKGDDLLRDRPGHPFHPQCLKTAAA